MRKCSTLVHIREYVEGTLFQVSEYELVCAKREGSTAVFPQ